MDYAEHSYIPDDMIRSAIENVVHRMQCVVNENDGHIEVGRSPRPESTVVEGNDMLHCNFISPFHVSFEFFRNMNLRTEAALR